IKEEKDNYTYPIEGWYWFSNGLVIIAKPSFIPKYSPLNLLCFGFLFVPIQVRKHNSCSLVIPFFSSLIE
ncbi:hypothetical protein M0Q97_09285, partial [Candidatus Dojkabacteria bacterium]|nr:hypothetical protein [Candidatus Dojkabacteria bacterium]